MIKTSQIVARRKSSVMVKRHRFLSLTTAAATAFSSTCCDAWVPASTTSPRALHTKPQPPSLQFDSRTYLNQQTLRGLPRSQRLEGFTTTRLYSSQKNKDQSFLSKIGEAAKKILPTSLFGSNEEKKKLARKKEYKDQVSGGLDTMLKDAPLGMRMMGKMISPIISSVASSLADTMAEQQRATDGIMDDARAYLMGDPAVVGLLGEPIQMGAPFSQSSSTSSINGQTQSRVEMVIPVTGSQLSGTMRILATQDGISQLAVDAGGRRLDVNLSSPSKRGSGSSSVFGKSSTSSRINGDDNIIEAEVIDKQSK